MTLRSLTTGVQVTDSQTVGSLFNQFDSNAATPWFTRTLAITQPSEQIEVTLTVANAVDNAYLSILYADVVQEATRRITNVHLRDLIHLDDTRAASRPFKALTRLSASPMPAAPVNLVSYGGYVRIHGTITVTGPPTDSLQMLYLDVLENGHVKAAGELARDTVSNVRSTLLNHPFGTVG